MVRKAHPVAQLLLIILTIIGAGIVIFFVYTGHVPVNPNPHPHASVTITEHSNNTTTILLTDSGTAETVYVTTNQQTHNLQVGKPITITTTNYTVIAEANGQQTIIISTQ